MSGTWTIKNLAVSGTTSAECEARASGRVDPWTYGPGKRIVAIWAGTNDSGAASATWNNLKQYGLDRKAVGWQVLIATMLSADGKDSFKNSLNALIRSEWASYFDGLVDVAADSRLGADGAYSDTTYFVDGVHPTTLSQETIIAPLFSDAINNL